MRLIILLAWIVSCCQASKRGANIVDDRPFKRAKGCGEVQNYDEERDLVFSGFVEEIDLIVTPMAEMLFRNDVVSLADFLLESPFEKTLERWNMKMIDFMATLEQKFLITFLTFPDGLMPTMDYPRFFASIATDIKQTIVDIEISFDAIFKDESLAAFLEVLTESVIMRRQKGFFREIGSALFSNAFYTLLLLKMRIGPDFDFLHFPCFFNSDLAPLPVHLYSACYLGKFNYISSITEYLAMTEDIFERATYWSLGMNHLEAFKKIIFDVKYQQLEIELPLALYGTYFAAQRGSFHVLVYLREQLNMHRFILNWDSLILRAALGFNHYTVADYCLSKKPLANLSNVIAYPLYNQNMPLCDLLVKTLSISNDFLFADTEWFVRDEQVEFAVQFFRSLVSFGRLSPWHVLVMAIPKINIATLKGLLKHLNPTPLEEAWRSPIGTAIIWNKLEHFKALLDDGRAQMSVPFHQYAPKLQTFMDELCHHRGLDRINVLCFEPDLGSTDVILFTQVIQMNSLELLQVLLTYPMFRPNTCNNFPVSFAAALGYWSLVEYLLAFPDVSLDRALFGAALFNNSSITNELLYRGANWALTAPSCGPNDYLGLNNPRIGFSDLCRNIKANDTALILRLYPLHIFRQATDFLFINQIPQDVLQHIEHFM